MHKKNFEAFLEGLKESKENSMHSYVELANVLVKTFGNIEHSSEAQKHVLYVEGCYAEKTEETTTPVLKALSVAGAMSKTLYIPKETCKALITPIEYLYNIPTTQAVIAGNFNYMDRKFKDSVDYTLVESMVKYGNNRVTLATDTEELAKRLQLYQTLHYDDWFRAEQLLGMSFTGRFTANHEDGYIKYSCI